MILNTFPIAALNQYAYCPSSLLADVLCWEFIDNQYTIEGTSLHERVHTVGDIGKKLGSCGLFGSNLNVTT